MKKLSLLMLIMWLAGCDPSGSSDSGEPKAEFGSIRGMVTNQNGNPLPDVEVRSAGVSGYTQQDGTYLLEQVPVGPQKVVAAAQLLGYALQGESTTVALSANAVADFQLHEHLASASVEYLASYWPMEAYEITAGELVPEFKGLPGVLNGDISLAKGQVGSALKFNGPDAFVFYRDDLSVMPALNQSFSITFWVKKAAGYVLGKSTNDACSNTQYAIEIDKTISFSTQSQKDAIVKTFQSQSELVPDAWNFVAITLDNTGRSAIGEPLQIFINGSKSAVNGPNPLFDLPFELQVSAYTTMGARATSAGKVCTADLLNFTGEIDEVSVWSIALSAEQIEDIRQFGLKGYTLF